VWSVGFLVTRDLPCDVAIVMLQDEDESIRHRCHENAALNTFIPLLHHHDVVS
jgi:hypothetical protein